MGTLDAIFVTQWGSGSERVVLIHGGVQGSKSQGAAHFARQEALAAQGYTLLVPDRPGHGKSADPGRPDDAEADGEWVAGLLGDGAHLVGHSFGGCVALAAAARRPEAVKSLTLIEPGMQAVAIHHGPVLVFVLKLVAALKLSFSNAARIRKFAKLMHIPPEVGGAAATAEEADAMGRAATVLKVPSKATLERQLALIREKKIPLLVVTGGWAAGVDITADVVAALGKGERVVIPSPHHFPQNVSDEFNELLVRFITESR